MQLVRVETGVQTGEKNFGRRKVKNERTFARIFFSPVWTLPHPIKLTAPGSPGMATIVGDFRIVHEETSAREMT